jgi:hypothetical protein
MTLEIKRDNQGRVLILDPSTGRSEVIMTAVQGREAEATIRPATDDLPSFAWDQRRT